MPQLFALHEVDARLLHLERTRQKLDNGERAKQAMLVALQDLRAREDALKRARTTQSTAETELKSNEAKQKDLSKRLYGGLVKTAKEAEAVEAEIKNLKERAGDLETQILELMDTIEGAEAGIREQTELVKKLDSELSGVLATFQKQTAAIDREVAMAQAQRADVLKHLSAPVIATYESIRRRTRDTAVALLDGNTCTGCHMQVPGISIMKLTGTLDFVPCDNCNRLLYRKA